MIKARKFGLGCYLVKIGKAKAILLTEEELLKFSTGIPQLLKTGTLDTSHSNGI